MTSLVRTIAVIFLLGIGNNTCVHAQPTIPSSQIPADAAAEVKAEFRKLYSASPLVRANAAADGL